MRKIIHVDMDCFFAAVEMRYNPHLRHIPLAIGGSADRRGVYQHRQLSGTTLWCAQRHVHRHGIKILPRSHGDPRSYGGV